MSISSDDWQATSTASGFTPRPDFRRPPTGNLLTAKHIARAFDLKYEPNEARTARMPLPIPIKINWRKFKLPKIRLPRVDIPRYRFPVMELPRIPWKPVLVSLLVLGGSMTLVRVSLSIDHLAMAWVGTRPIAPHTVVSESANSTKIIEPAAHQAGARLVENSPPVKAEQPEPVPAAHPEDVRSIWNRALEAESHKNYTSAMRLYERIQSLPNSEWPHGLTTRLQLTQQEELGLH